jgi:hypothetical protein
VIDQLRVVIPHYLLFCLALLFQFFLFLQNLFPLHLSYSLKVFSLLLSCPLLLPLMLKDLLFSHYPLFNNFLLKSFPLLSFFSRLLVFLLADHLKVMQILLLFALFILLVLFHLFQELFTHTLLVLT